MLNVSGFRFDTARLGRVSGFGVASAATQACPAIPAASAKPRSGAFLNSFADPHGGWTAPPTGALVSEEIRSACCALSFRQVQDFLRFSNFEGQLYNGGFEFAQLCITVNQSALESSEPAFGRRPSSLSQARYQKGKEAVVFALSNGIVFGHGSGRIRKSTPVHDMRSVRTGSVTYSTRYSSWIIPPSELIRWIQ
jgi:hypothetical protein